MTNGNGIRIRFLMQKVKKKLTKHLKKICSDTTDLKKQLKKTKQKR